MQSYLGEDAQQTYTATVTVISDARLWLIRASDFGDAVRDWFPMAMHLLEGLFFGMRNSQQIVGQRQQLLALGALTAGLTHELNNPAAAAVRANAALRDRFAAMRRKLAMLAHEEIDPRLLELLVDVQEEAVLVAADAPELTPMQESEREDELTDWLEEHGVGGAWELAPVFVAGGHDAARSSTGSPRARRRRSSRAPCAGCPTRWRPSCCSTRSPTRSPGSPPWWPPRSSTPTWTGRRSSAPTSTTG